MQGNNLFSILFSTVKSKFSGFVAKFRLFFNWTFIKNQVIIKIRDFFMKLLDIRPKHKHDYYGVGRWLVSKRLVVFIVVVIGVLSLWYVVANMSAVQASGGSMIKTYNYDSVLLRFTKGKVRIKARSGYVAYEGNVDNGAVTGTGELYSPAGLLVYKGDFKDNKYNGEGTDYYDNGAMRYQGNFTNNLYYGEGKLYRPDGSLEYSGAFEDSMKNGEGELYDNSSSKVYTGNFAYDSIVYSDLLGVPTDEISDKYKGKRQVYTDSDYFAVMMPDIDAMYIGDTQSETMDDKVTTTAVYVMKDTFSLGKVKAATIDDLKQIFGDPVYEGNSQVIMPEAVIINYLNDHSEGRILKGPVDTKETKALDDVVSIDSYNRSYEVYLYCFEANGLRYDFVTGDRDSGFFFYSINPQSS